MEPTDRPNRTPEQAAHDVLDWVPHVAIENGQRVAWGGLSPRQVPKAWERALQAAGVSGAKIARVNNNGQWMTLPLVVQFDCPWDHVDESGERWAKVLLKVDPDTGWVSIHRDSCGYCSQEAIEAWLVTCPRCAAGETVEEHWDHDYDCLFCLFEGDESPVAYVLAVMCEMETGRPSEFLADVPATKAIAPSFTRESAVEWLGKQLDESGGLLVPPTMGQASAWEVVRELPGHPSQTLVREAQAVRKAGV